MRSTALIIALTAMLFGAPPLHGVSGVSSAHSPDPGSAVFQIRVIQLLPTGGHLSIAQGTGFFIAPDGRALTNSHVVYKAVHDPAHYRLTAIVGPEGSAEFYGVTVDCASTLSYDAGQVSETTPVRPGRDVALIHLMPSTLPMVTWIEFLPTGRKWPLATAHAGPLPAFPALQVAGAPIPGMHVRITGYGARRAPLARRTLTGEVGQLQRTEDGTEIFRVALHGRVEQGYSGSPVLDDRNQVIGLWTWSTSPNPTAMGDAQGNTALAQPCP